MKDISTPIIQRSIFVTILTDITALIFIYLVPTISHLVSLPVYLIEPMRLALILAMVHTNKKNAYLLALTMPLFSLLISGHPIPPKMLLMALELFMNVFLFHALLKRKQPVFPSILMSIVLSKIIYYFLKFILIRFMVISTDLVTTPVLIQMVTTILFSSYLYMFYRKSAT
ncbi:MAG: hypothetical protein Q8M08_03080 [Bacteroidales bacterium]|nr:hypothetical protein [Bacteroidales bacterium]